MLNGAAGARHALCMGACMVEVVVPDGSEPKGRVGFAGDSFNASVYLKRAAPALSVGYVTAVGVDAVSERMVAAFEAERLDTALVERRSDQGTRCYAIVNDTGRASVSLLASPVGGTAALRRRREARAGDGGGGGGGGRSDLPLKRHLGDPHARSPGGVGGLLDTAPSRRHAGGVRPELPASALAELRALGMNA